MRGVRCSRLPFLAAMMMLLGLSVPYSARAQNSAGGTKSLDRTAYASLRDVINYGADLFNNQGDYAGCYQAYRTGLMTVRPFLAHHPDLQEIIDDGLARAEDRGRVVARAFALRAVLGEVRKELEKRSGPFTAQAPQKSPPEQKRETKRVEEKRVAKKENVPEKLPPPVPKLAQLSGKITYKGQPVAGGWYVTLVSATDKHTFSTYIRADGTYTFKTPMPAGNYTIAIEEGLREKGKPPPVAIPQRYQNPVTSGLTIQVQPGENRHDVSLQ
jgi:hypothetical protein